MVTTWRDSNLSGFLLEIRQKAVSVPSNDCLAPLVLPKVGIAQCPSHPRLNGSRELF